MKSPRPINSKPNWWIFAILFTDLCLQVHTDDCRLGFGVKWWSHVSFIVTYLRKNSALLRLIIFHHCSESSTRRCFWSKVSSRGTHFAQSFLIPKYSWMIWCTYLVDIFSACYFIQFQFTIIQNHFMDFLNIFVRNNLFSTSTTFTIFGVPFTTSKLSIPILDGWFSCILSLQKSIFY